jgi:hypothetical protein
VSAVSLQVHDLHELSTRKQNYARRFSIPSTARMPLAQAAVIPLLVPAPSPIIQMPGFA